MGGVCSPILSNIYLHELDTRMANMRDRFNTGKKRGDNKEYRRLSYQIQSLWRKEDNLPLSAKTERAAIHAQRLQLNLARQGVPSNDPMDPHYKRLRYCRYADDVRRITKC